MTKPKKTTNQIRLDRIENAADAVRYDEMRSVGAGRLGIGKFALQLLTGMQDERLSVELDEHKLAADLSIVELGAALSQCIVELRRHNKASACTGTQAAIAQAKRSLWLAQHRKGAEARGEIAEQETSTGEPDAWVDILPAGGDCCRCGHWCHGAELQLELITGNKVCAMLCHECIEEASGVAIPLSKE